MTNYERLVLATLDREFVLMCTSFNEKRELLKSASKNIGLREAPQDVQFFKSL